MASASTCLITRGFNQDQQIIAFKALKTRYLLLADQAGRKPPARVGTPRSAEPMHMPGRARHEKKSGSDYHLQTRSGAHGVCGVWEQVLQFEEKQ